MEFCRVSKVIDQPCLDRTSKTDDLYVSVGVVDADLDPNMKDVPMSVPQKGEIVRRLGPVVKALDRELSYDCGSHESPIMDTMVAGLFSAGKAIRYSVTRFASAKSMKPFPRCALAAATK